MYCQDCGTEISHQGAIYCPECGAEIQSLNEHADSKEEENNSRPFQTPSENESSPDNPTEEAGEWDPKMPISSVFISILFLWISIEYGAISLIIFGIPGFLIIPRVRRHVVPWVNDKLGIDLTTRTSMVATGVTYSLGGILAFMLGLGSTGNNIAGASSRVGFTYGVWFATLGIMIVMAFGLVFLIRLSRWSP